MCPHQTQQEEEPGSRAGRGAHLGSGWRPDRSDGVGGGEPAPSLPSAPKAVTHRAEPAGRGEQRGPPPAPGGGASGPAGPLRSAPPRPAPRVRSPSASSRRLPATGSILPQSPRRGLARPTPRLSRPASGLPRPHSSRAFSRELWPASRPPPRRACLAWRPLRSSRSGSCSRRRRRLWSSLRKNVSVKITN